jgi:hypothetical protein
VATVKKNEGGVPGHVEAQHQVLLQERRQQAQPKTYPVAVNEHGLRVREKPSTSARVVGGLFPGDRVRMICTTVGTTVHGRLGTSNI